MADDLVSLISSGRLPVGVKLSHRGRPAELQDITATVTELGLRAKGHVYSTPSGAAKAYTGKPVDGWIYWRLPNGEPLDSLRSDRRRRV
jgi:Restriction Enzyme Adenine Methylase Associated